MLGIVLGVAITAGLVRLVGLLRGRAAGRELLTTIKFHLARRRGYDPGDVDTFVDLQLKRLGGAA